MTVMSSKVRPMNATFLSGSLAATKVVLEIAGRSVLEHRDNENRTPLILAAMGGHGELLNYLLSSEGTNAVPPQIYFIPCSLVRHAA